MVRDTASYAFSYARKCLEMVELLAVGSDSGRKMWVFLYLRLNHWGRMGNKSPHFSDKLVVNGRERYMKRESEDMCLRAIDKINTTFSHYVLLPSIRPHSTFPCLKFNALCQRT